METIVNLYDGPTKSAKHLSKHRFNLDYINSDDAAEIDAGIRDSIKGVRLSILAMWMGLARLKEKGLFIDLNYHSMNDYLEKLCDDMKIERSTAHNWLWIGEAYTKYRRELERIEFSDAEALQNCSISKGRLKYTKKERFSKLSKN